MTACPSRCSKHNGARCIGTHETIQWHWHRGAGGLTTIVGCYWVTESEWQTTLRKRKPKHGQTIRGGKVEATYQSFEDGTIKIVFAEPIKVRRSKWHRDKLDVLESTPK